LELDIAGWKDYKWKKYSFGWSKNTVANFRNSSITTRQHYLTFPQLASNKVDAMKTETLTLACVFCCLQVWELNTFNNANHMQETLFPATDSKADS